MDGARGRFLPHVEGLRGLMALYVFAYHIWQVGIAQRAATMPQLLAFTPFLQFGHFAVAVFIVISGYCLGLPVAANPERFDPLRFFKRRARRLLPAYIFVLFASLLPFCAMLFLRGQHVPIWHVAVALAAHLALVHNLIPPLTEYINGPMWSIALECQIYVVYALLLVPVWRRFGLWAQLLVAAILGLLPHFVLRGALDGTAPWLLALFAMGVAAAGATVRGGRPATWLTAAMTVFALSAMLRNGEGTPDGNLCLPDLVVGAAVAVFFAWSADRTSIPVRALCVRPVLLLGAFSYSLYLVHGPLVLLTAALATRLRLDVGPSALAYGALVPLVLAIAYGTYRLAERPFLSAMVRSANDAEEQGASARDVAAIGSAGRIAGS